MFCLCGALSSDYFLHVFDIGVLLFFFLFCRLSFCVYLYCFCLLLQGVFRWIIDVDFAQKGDSLGSLIF
jgi:hypothetical protein